MANGKVEDNNDIFLGCTLTLNNYSFQIDLMSVTIKSFDIIIGMDWLSPHHADILCYETLIIYGNKPDMNLQIISCIKA